MKFNRIFLSLFLLLLSFTSCKKKDDKVYLDKLSDDFEVHLAVDIKKNHVQKEDKIGDEETNIKINSLLKNEQKSLLNCYNDAISSGFKKSDPIFVTDAYSTLILTFINNNFDTVYVQFSYEFDYLCIYSFFEDDYCIEFEPYDKFDEFKFKTVMAYVTKTDSEKTITTTFKEYN